MTYTRMDRMSTEDSLRLGGMPLAFRLDHLLRQLALLKDEDPQRAAADRYTHSLQTATRCVVWKAACVRFCQRWETRSPLIPRTRRSRSRPSCRRCGRSSAAYLATLLIAR